MEQSVGEYTRYSCIKWIYRFTSTTIRTCNNTGNITEKYDYVGGIVGFIYDSRTASSIKNCYNTGAICGGEDSPSGGIVGYVGNEVDTAISISSCYNTGAVNGGSSGGIVGSMFGKLTLDECYNASDVKGIYAGGIVGYMGETFSVATCYYLDSINKGVGNETDSSTRCTESALKQQATFVDFDFTEVWTMEGSEEYLYPELRAFITTEPDSIGVASVSASNAQIILTNSAAGTCYVAVYSNESKMLSCGLTTVTAGVGAVKVSLAPFTTTSPYSVKAFLVDTQGIPVCQCAES